MYTNCRGDDGTVDLKKKDVLPDSQSISVSIFDFVIVIE